MKIIHTADLHIGSSFRTLSRSDREKRNQDLINTFIRLVSYAKQNGVKVILLAGDVFDTKERQYARLKDKKAFYDIVSNNKNIDFLYLKGNHDNMQPDNNPIDNLYTFNSKEWTYYTKEDVRIAGIEFGDENAPAIYDSLSLNNDKYNIVMMHGQNTSAKDTRRNLKETINIHLLKNKNIDYLALGHIHSYKEGRIDERGRWAYSGCLMGRGFDEAGEKGFVLIDTERKSAEFIPFAEHKIIIEEIDISNADNAYTALGIVEQALNGIRDKQKHMLKVVLTGNIVFDPEKERLVSCIESNIKGFFYHKVENKTRRKYFFNDFIGNKSLQGAFVDIVMGNEELDDETKNKIMDLGLSVLMQ